MKTSKYLVCLTAFAFAACVQSPDQKEQSPSTPAPTVADNAPPQHFVLPAQQAPKPAVKPEPPKEAEAVVASKDEPKTPMPPVVDTPPAPKPETVSFRCAYWTKPENARAVFVKQNGEYTRLELFEMAFPKAYTVELPVTLYVQDGKEYVPLTQIDNAGLKDFAAILLPSFYPLPNSVASGVHIFTMEKNDVRDGCLVVHNWLGNKISGKMHFKRNAQNRESFQTFTLDFGECCVSHPVVGRRQICSVEILSGEGENQKVLFSSGLPVYGEHYTTHLFMIPHGDSIASETPSPAFRSFWIKRD